MPKKLAHTPKSKITSPIRRIWLYSRERAAALKRDGKTCQCCGATGKLHVHHINPIGKKAWAEIEALIRKYVLVNPRFLTTLCKRCHKLAHKNDI